MSECFLSIGNGLTFSNKKKNGKITKCFLANVSAKCVLPDYVFKCCECLWSVRKKFIGTHHVNS